MKVCVCYITHTHTIPRIFGNRAADMYKYRLGGTEKNEIRGLQADRVNSCNFFKYIFLNYSCSLIRVSSEMKKSICEIFCFYRKILVILFNKKNMQILHNFRKYCIFFSQIFASFSMVHYG